MPGAHSRSVRNKDSLKKYDPHLINRSTFNTYNVNNHSYIQKKCIPQKNSFCYNYLSLRRHKILAEHKTPNICTVLFVLERVLYSPFLLRKKIKHRISCGNRAITLLQASLSDKFPPEHNILIYS